MRKLLLIAIAFPSCVTTAQAQRWVSEEYEAWWVENDKAHDFRFSKRTKITGRDSVITFHWSMWVMNNKNDDMKLYATDTLELVPLSDTSYTIPNFYHPSLKDLPPPTLVWVGKKMTLLHLNLQWINLKTTKLVLKLKEDEDAPFMEAVDD